MPSLNNATVTAKFRCHPSSRPPRPAPAPPADFSVTLRLLSRRGHYSGPRSSAAAARTGFYCTASLALDTDRGAPSILVASLLCFLPVSVVSLQSGSGAGVRGTETGDTSWGW